MVLRRLSTHAITAILLTTCTPEALSRPTDNVESASAASDAWLFNSGAPEGLQAHRPPSAVPVAGYATVAARDVARSPVPGDPVVPSPPAAPLGAAADSGQVDPSPISTLGSDAGPTQSKDAVPIVSNSDPSAMVAGRAPPTSPDPPATERIGAVVGGSDVLDGSQYPWMVSIRVYGNHHCGGSLVAPNAVLTAAHCVVSESTGLINVPLEATTLHIGGLQLSSPSLAVVNASAFQVHPQYNYRAFSYDAAIIWLAQPVDAIPPVQMYGGTDSQLFSQAFTLTAVGWGSQAFMGPVSDALQQVEIPVVSQSMCVTVLGNSFVPQTEYCAGNLATGGLDTCQGDSGGPLLFQPDTGANVLVAIVSHGRMCGMPGQPGVYTKVNAVRQWVLSQQAPANLG